MVWTQEIENRIGNYLISSPVRFQSASTTCTRARPVRTVPRHHATNCRPPVKTPRRAVPFESNRLAVPATDPTTRPCTGCALPGSDRTSVRPRRLNGVCRRSYRRTRDALVCLDERQAAQLLGVPAIRRTARRYRRGVQHNHRSPHGSVDLADVSELRLNQGHNAASGHAHLSLRLRRPRGSRHKRDVPGDGKKT